MLFTQNDLSMKYLLLLLLPFLTACSRTLPYAIQTGDNDIVVEAESFLRQREDDVRRWYTPDDPRTATLQDADPNHTEGAVGTYLEILPDTRQTHDDVLTRGENFTNEAGKMAILEYPVVFTTPGRYYVWVRAYYTGSEDNGVHVGLNGEWPPSGQRMQWCNQANEWHWESKQRTNEEHCGVEKLIYLDVPSAGVHTVMFSMREDGFEMDRFLLSTTYRRPRGQGPSASQVQLLKPRS